MTIDQLIFVGLNGYALALDRNTGDIVWSNNDLRSGPVTLLLDGDRLIVSTGGYMFCLNPLSGEVLWNNPLSGYGQSAPTAIVSVRGQTSQVLAHLPDDDDAAAAVAITAGIAATTSSSSAG